ncbi:low density lipoprotein receptor adapter protein 1 [Amyelois transitella]|uniref:low density lipoprotein receptor adapter protein 1 n=1 Tax=Amyelois transitella TaxID=680683 RepID=UPI00067BA188|nr:low density lipoprotein receptor adapter protein 1 [Amyelois transitella]
MAEAETPITVDDLPMSFQVKYLGQRDAKGLWGIKHTRKPVDLMVAAAKALPPDQILPIVKLVISTDGVLLETLNHGVKRDQFESMSVFFKIESISYGVQDLVYTRVFSMITVKDTANVKGLNPFECHGFVCESRNAARRLIYSLSAAFQDYSRRVKELQAGPGESDERHPSFKKRFAIDLRTPEEIEADLETEA